MIFLPANNRVLSIQNEYTLTYFLVSNLQAMFNSFSNNNEFPAATQINKKKPMKNEIFTKKVHNWIFLDQLQAKKILNATDQSK